MDNLALILIEQVDTIKKQYNKNNNTISDCDMRLSDLYHLIEFGNVKVHPMKIIKEMRRVLEVRRKAKHDNQAFSVIIKDNKNIIKDDIRRSCEKQIEQYNPKYKNRVYSENFIELNK